MLDALLVRRAADAGMSDVVLGMAHRGRLNVLANVVGKSYDQIFREFEGELDPAVTQGSGDVKYHLGATGDARAAPRQRRLAITLAANPSHLEAVDPVVEGMARAAGDRLGDAERRRACSPCSSTATPRSRGRGWSPRPSTCREVAGYEVGGTVHIVVNNQLGFTTAPEFGRSRRLRHRRRQDACRHRSST